MPTKKPVIQIVLEQKYFDKLKAIANENERKTSDQGRRIIEKYIDDYERNNGDIISKSMNINGSNINNSNISM